MKAGSSAAGSAARAVEELKQFNAVFALDELAVTRLRLRQALRRDPQLADLLGPGDEEIERVMRWLREMIAQGKVSG